MRCLDDPGSDSITPTVLRLLLDAGIVTCIVCINLFILYAVLRYWKPRVGATSNNNSKILIISLCLADLAVAISFVYTFLPRYICSLAEYLSHHKIPCLLHSIPIGAGHWASSLTLVAISVDRYFAVMHVLRYPEIMTPRRTTIMVIIGWAVSISLTFSQFHWNNWKDGEVCENPIFQNKYYNFIVMPTMTFSTVIIMGTIYWRIHRVAMTVHNRRVDHCLTAKERLYTKSAKTLLLIILLYSISWMPFVITTVVKQAGCEVSLTLLEVLGTMTKITYLGNPFIYALNTKPVKQSVTKVVSGIKMKFKRSDSQDSNHSKATISTTFSRESSRRECESVEEVAVDT